VPFLPSVNPPLAAFPVRLTELPLQELARRIARERVREVDRRRALEVRETLASVRDDVFGRRRGPGLANDDRLHGLAPLLVGYADGYGVRAERRGRARGPPGSWSFAGNSVIAPVVSVRP